MAMMCAARLRLCANHPGRRLHAAGRHAVDSGGDDPVPDLHVQTEPERHRCRRQQRQPERLRRSARLHQHHRQHFPSRGLSHHPGHHPAGRLAQPWTWQRRAERQPRLSHQVRLRAVQPRRLDGQGILGPAGHPADAVGRFRRGHLSLPVPGHGVRGARPAADGDDVRGCGRVVPLQPPVELWRYPRRRLQRRELPAGRSQRSEGARIPRHAPAVREGPAGAARASRRTSSTTTITTRATTSASA